MKFLQVNLTRNAAFQSEIAWDAICAGVLISLSYMVLFHFLGVSLEIVTMDLEVDNLSEISLVAVMWVGASNILAMAIGGWFVGKFSTINDKFKRVCHGLLAWGLTFLLTLVIATTASGFFLGGVVNLAKNNVLCSKITNSASSDQHQLGHTSLLNQIVPDQNSSNNLVITPEAATNNIARISIVIFITMLLGGIASVIGAVYGGRGSVRQDEVTELANKAEKLSLATWFKNHPRESIAAGLIVIWGLVKFFKAAKKNPK